MEELKSTAKTRQKVNWVLFTASRGGDAVTTSELSVHFQCPRARMLLGSLRAKEVDRGLTQFSHRQPFRAFFGCA